MISSLQIELSTYLSLPILTGICEFEIEFTPNREWYLPFQKFRSKLVKLVDELLDILDTQKDFYFSFDGQTIVLEDYLEIRTENREKLFQYICENRIIVGPWYVLPDIWLVGEESLIRNLEYSFDLAKDFKIPLMNLGYLPDMFGHSRAIPQLLGDLTNFSALIVWRGVPPEITTVPFQWKSDHSSKTSMLSFYLPFGYGNAAHLPLEINKLTKEIMNLINQLEPFSPLPVYLLHHGTDHQVPNRKITSVIPKVHIENVEISLGVLTDFTDKSKHILNEYNYQPPVYNGELRSAARAHLLQDTYSSRMWIKQWNQKVEDLLVHYAEPLNAYTWFYFEKEYPTSFLKQAWKWHLRNQPHDSICGCSIDQTHDEMKFRYSFAESITENLIEDAITNLEDSSEPSSGLSCLVYNPTNCVNFPVYFEFIAPLKTPISKLKNSSGLEYELQPIHTSSDKIWEMTVSSNKLRALMKMLPGRELMGLFINEASLNDGDTPETCEVQLLMGEKEEGEFDAGKMKNEFREIIDSKKYKKFHILVTKELKQSYGTLVPLKQFGFSKFSLLSEPITTKSRKSFQISKDRISNDFFEVTFNKNGTFNLFDKINTINYSELHKFEDWGDRGDEYTFGRLEPEFVKTTNINRSIAISGPLFCDIKQNMDIELFLEVDSKREKRIGKARLPIKTLFRFYRDLPRIDIKTELTNNAKDHRLRICFDLPFSSKFTLTSTHFGYIRRYGDPIGDESYIEKPSGIQPQKRYIRVEDDKGKAAVTLMNKGLPEVELVNGSRLAITLLRSVGWLSRSGIPERPEHAGPYYATPGAQELGVKYTFNYSFITHSKEEPMHRTVDHSEIFSLMPKSIILKDLESRKEITEPLITLSNPNIRITSLRMRSNKLWVTLFNLIGQDTTIKAKLQEKIKKMARIKIDGTEIENIEIIGNEVTLNFTPYEIMIFTLE